MDENRNSSGLPEEFDRLYLECKPKLMQMVMSTINDQNLAEDVVQEVFYEVCRKREVFDNHPNQMGWLYTVTRFKLQEFLRKLLQCEEWSTKPEFMEINYEDEGFAESEMQLVLYEALTPEELLRFRRYFFWGETVEEIARKENVTENKMRVKISRLKKKVEKALRKK